MTALNPLQQQIHDASAQDIADSLKWLGKADEVSRLLARTVKDYLTVQEDDAEQYDWQATPNVRWHTPNNLYIASKLEREFIVTDQNGVSGSVWAEIHPESPFVRVKRTL